MASCSTCCAQNTQHGACETCYWRELVATLAARLQWYVDNDDTNDTEDNKPWLAGKQAAIDALKRVPAAQPATAEEKPAEPKHKLIPHPSHDMSEWRQTIVTLIATPRFGSLRECKNCGGEQAVTVSGEAMHDELNRECR